MGNTSQSTMIFDAEASRAVSELQKLAAAQRQVNKDMREAGDAARKGSTTAEMALRILAKEFIKNKAAIDQRKASIHKDLNETKRNAAVQKELDSVLQTQVNSWLKNDRAIHQATTSTAVLARTQRRTQMEVGQLAFAVDDFVTVLQMPGMGLTHALRASANNMSVLLMGIHPLAAMIPSLATAAVTMASGFFKAAEAENKLAKEADNAVKKLQDQLAVMKDINQQQGVERELEFQDQLRPLRRKEIQIRQELARLDESEQKVQELFRMGAAPAGQLRQRAILRKRLKKEQVEVGQQISLLQQVKDEEDAQKLENKRQADMERQRQQFEEAAAEQDRRIQQSLSSRLSPIQSELVGISRDAIKQGRSEDAIRQMLNQRLAPLLPVAEQEMLPEQIDEIMRQALNQKITGQLQPGPTQRQKRTQQISERLGELSIEAMDLDTGRRSRKASGRMLEIQDEQKKLNKEMAELNLQTMKEANRGIENEVRGTNDRLDELIGAVQSSGGLRSKTTRTVDR